MSNLQIFKNEMFKVSIQLENGEILFDVENVARCLGFTEIKSKKEYVRWRTVNGYLKFSQDVAKGDFIPESAVYKLAFKANNEVAEKFQDWLAIEVIPSIRKHGAYLTDEKIEEVLTDPDTIIKLATQLKEERSRRLEAERFNKQIAISENSLLVREVAKIASKDNIVIGEKRLWNKLRDWGLIFKDTTEPKQEYIDRGYFEVVEGAKDTYKGTFTYRTTRVTGKGQLYIIKRLIKEQEIA